MIEPNTLPADYHAFGCGDPSVVSRSELWSFYKAGPWAFREEGPSVLDPHNPSLRFGSAVDALVLTPEAFSFSLCNLERVSQKWKDSHSDGMWLKPKELENAQRAAQNALRRLPESFEPQIMITEPFEHAGVEVTYKCLVDYAHEDYATIGDLKTSRDVSWAYPDGKMRPGPRALGYPFQAGAYTWAWERATGIAPEWEWTVVGNFAPFEARPYRLEPGDIKTAQNWFLEALRGYCECLATDTWPEAEEVTLTL